MHAILRRLDDDYCDPLELRPTRRSACPGCWARCARGRVALANALGSGLLESAAWQGFLPGASQLAAGRAAAAAIGGDLVVRRAGRRSIT